MRELHNSGRGRGLRYPVVRAAAVRRERGRESFSHGLGDGRNLPGPKRLPTSFPFNVDGALSADPRGAGLAGQLADPAGGEVNIGASGQLIDAGLFGGLVL